MSHTIMIVDDANFMRVTLKNILAETELEVIAESKNGLEAVEKYKQLEPDIVTMDITMPEMDGITAAEKILNYDEEANIIIVSAMGQKHIVIDAIELGVSDFIIKPFRKDKVIKILRDSLDENLKK